MRSSELDKMMLQSIWQQTNADHLTQIMVFGNSMLPLYRHGDQLIVSDSIPVKIGDRIIVKASKHGTLGGTLIYRDKKRIVINIGGVAKKSCSIEMLEVDFLGRIVWASQ